MAKMVVPTGLCAGVDIDGRRYRARDGILAIPDEHRTRAQASGCFPVSNQPRGFDARGFVCSACGFHALIRTCGRCGSDCTRPEDLSDPDHEEVS